MNNYELLSLLANILQIINFKINIEQSSNDEIMKHLLQQDYALDEQTNIYLKEIIKQNEEIIKLLKGGNSDAY